MSACVSARLGAVGMQGRMRLLGRDREPHGLSGHLQRIQPCGSGPTRASQVEHVLPGQHGRAAAEIGHPVGEHVVSRLLDRITARH